MMMRYINSHYITFTVQHDNVLRAKHYHLDALAALISTYQLLSCQHFSGKYPVNYVILSHIFPVSRSMYCV